MTGTSASTRLQAIGNRYLKLSPRKLYALLFALSFLVHLSVVLVLINLPIALDDMFQYDMLARSLQEGNGYRWYAKADMEILRPYYSQFLDLDRLVFPENGIKTAFRAPGYPFFLAFLYGYVPAASRFVLARIVQAALSAGLAVLVAVLSRQLGFSLKTALLAGLSQSFYPILLFYPLGLATENLYLFLGTLSVILILKCTQKKGWYWVIFAGVCCAALLFTRSIFAVFSLFAAGWLARFHPHKTRAALLFLAIAFGLCLPWSLRNSLLMGKPAFVENSAAYNLFIGYHPEGDGTFVSHIAIQPMNILDDAQRDAYCWQEAIRFIRANPLDAIRRVFVRWFHFIGAEDREFFYFYSNNLIGKIPQPGLALLYSTLLIPWLLTLLLGVFGLLNLPVLKNKLLIFLYMGGYAAPHLAFLGEPRFHLAWVPVLLPFAACTWQNRTEIFRLRTWTPFINGKFVVLLLIAVSFGSGFALNLPKLIAILGENGHLLRFSY